MCIYLGEFWWYIQYICVSAVYTLFSQVFSQIIKRNRPPKNILPDLGESGIYSGGYRFFRFLVYRGNTDGRFLFLAYRGMVIFFFLWLPVNRYHGSFQISSYRGNRFFRLPRLPRLPW